MDAVKADDGELIICPVDAGAIEVYPVKYCNECCKEYWFEELEE